MDYATLVSATDTHGEALRTAAIEAGERSPVPSCPNWTVFDLVSHVTRVQSRILAATADPSGEAVRAAAAEPRPSEWDGLLARWDGQRKRLRDTFAESPGTPAWLPFPGLAPTLGSWARRLAHELAIHRVDAELAAGGSTAAPVVTFDPDFAADGIDELLTLLVQRDVGWDEHTARGTVLVHADDASRLWSLRLAPGEAPHFDERAFEPELAVEGPADAVYKALWHRGGAATITGDATLLAPLSPP